MKVKYTTERKTGLIMPGFSRVKEDKTFNVNVQQLTFKKIIFGIFALMIYFSIGSFSDFIYENGKVDERYYTQPLAVVDSSGNVEFDEAGFNTYREMIPPVSTLTSTVDTINDIVIAIDYGGAGKLNFEDWLRVNVPVLADWKDGTFDKDEDGILGYIYYVLNKIQSILYSIIEFIGRFFYTLFYRLKWVFDLLWNLLAV